MLSGVSIPIPAGRSEKQGGNFQVFVKGDLNVFRVALSPDDWTFCDSWCFLLPQTFFTSPNFFQEASCFHLSLEWMRRRLSTVGGNGGN